MILGGRLSAFVLFPLAVQLGGLFLFFNIPDGMFDAVFILPAILALSAMYVDLLIRRGLDYKKIYDSVLVSIKSEDRVVLFAFCFLIVFLSPLDVYFNGLKLLNPSTYAEFHGPGRYIRHITSLCWLLIPVSFFLCHKKPMLQIFFIFFALAFPIVIIDRNRLFMSAYSWIFLLYIQYRADSIRKNKKAFTRVKACLLFLVLVVPIGFSLIGLYRSGAAFDIDSSGTQIVNGKYPLNDFFQIFPDVFKQLILYVTSPLLNFSHVFSLGFQNSEFLLSQLSPFSRADYPLYPYAPILIERFNVGTEFYPFLLFGGIPYVIVSVFFMIFTFGLSLYFFSRHTNIYMFFVFIKISYSVLFLGFAPQFYILYNFLCLLLMFCLFISSKLCRAFLVGNH